MIAFFVGIIQSTAVQIKLAGWLASWWLAVSWVAAGWQLTAAGRRLAGGLYKYLAVFFHTLQDIFFVRFQLYNLQVDKICFIYKKKADK